MTSNTPQKQLDPLRDVMSYELLSVAHGLLAAGQNERYWAAVRTPKRPVGEVPFERARQVFTFVAPVLLAGVAGLLYGQKGLLMAVPAACLLGYALDRRLSSDIAKKRVTDEKIDAGRYRAVKFLSEQLGLPREAITLDVIRKMAADYAVEKQKRDLVEAQAKAEHAAAIARSVRPRGGSHRYGQGAAAAFGGAAAVSSVSAFEDSAPVYSEPSHVGFDHGLSVNPANGLPMIHGGAIDVQGNPFGTDGY